MRTIKDEQIVKAVDALMQTYGPAYSPAEFQNAILTITLELALHPNPHVDFPNPPLRKALEDLKIINQFFNEFKPQEVQSC